ncbi:N-acetyltransferase 9-like protein [Cyphellophora attinorum]|uniref:N-acetyltransferase 9-like protein n=1 Tax=Cyphellophora attinorum TaxID=1664694 RepID=A0A0N1HI29_9EURO|nr:N-acetyltransferase 9-like protein [Phialophora attinorum]KPI45837.1 N-acetyltransferase 9-like protein [Phialophora attinorum]
MLINKDKAICTPKLILVPYSAHHVPRYHSWMKDPEIQQLTASEPLSLDEENEMQRSWRTDADKLTFIIGVPDVPISRGTFSFIHGNEGYTAIGDVNLFLQQDFDSNAPSESEGREVLAAELELMIAEPSMRGKGLGRAALLLFLQYILENKKGIMEEYRAEHAFGFEDGFDFFRVKIGEHNKASRRLFESLGFEQVGEGPNFFGELELRTAITLDELEGLRRKFGVEAGSEVRYVDAEDHEDNG